MQTWTQNEITFINAARRNDNAAVRNFVNDDAFFLTLSVESIETASMLARSPRVGETLRFLAQLATPASDSESESEDDMDE